MQHVWIWIYTFAEETHEGCVNNQFKKTKLNFLMDLYKLWTFKAGQSKYHPWAFGFKFKLHVFIICHYKPLSMCDVGMQSGSLKLFANVDQKPMLLKRQAFAMFSGEIDQYHLYLPLIQGAALLLTNYWKYIHIYILTDYKNPLPLERLTEALRMNPSPAVLAQMFLMFRVLLLRISSQHLTSLWPIMVTELVRSQTLRPWDLDSYRWTQYRMSVFFLIPIFFFNLFFRFAFLHV